MFANQATMAIVAAGQLEQLRALAQEDPLTGLLNRRAFMRELNSELERTRRYGRAFALAVCDHDLKPINDTHGHPAATARCAGRRDPPRSCGRATRVPHRRRRVRRAAARDDAGAAGEAVRRVVAAVNAGGPDLREGIGISFGIALCPEHGMSAEELIRRADEALYAAKRERGGIRFAGAAA